MINAGGSAVYSGDSPAGALCCLLAVPGAGAGPPVPSRIHPMKSASSLLNLSFSSHISP